MNNTYLFKFGLGAVSETIKLSIPPVYNSLIKNMENTGLLLLLSKSKTTVLFINLLYFLWIVYRMELLIKK